MEQLDKDIERAKETENRPLKKELKRKHVAFIPCGVLQTNSLLDKTSCS